jgi:hypothetical protein
MYKHFPYFTEYPPRLQYKEQFLHFFQEKSILIAEIIQSSWIHFVGKLLSLYVKACSVQVALTSKL